MQLQNNLKYTKYAVDVSLIHFLMCLVHVERWYIIFFIIFKFNKAYYANISNVVNIWLIKFTVTALYIYCLISTLNLSVLLSISFYNLSWEMFYRIWTKLIGIYEVSIFELSQWFYIMKTYYLQEFIRGRQFDTPSHFKKN